MVLDAAYQRDNLQVSRAKAEEVQTLPRQMETKRRSTLTRLPCGSEGSDLPERIVRSRHNRRHRVAVQLRLRHRGLSK